MPRPYYNPEASYSVDNITEIGYIDNDMFLRVAHIKDITQLVTPNGDSTAHKFKLIDTGSAFKLLVEQDLSQDWLWLYECINLTDFPHNMDVAKQTIYFAASKKTGAHDTFYTIGNYVIMNSEPTIELATVHSADSIHKFKKSLDAQNIYENIGYVRELSANNKLTRCGATYIRLEDGNFRHNLAREFVRFTKEVKQLLEKRKKLNSEYNKSKAYMDFAKDSCARFKGEK